MLNGMAEPEVPDYFWLCDPVRRPDAMCITVATGLSPEEALVAFGADPDAEPVALADLVDGEDSSVAVVPLAGAVVAIEDNGWQGSRREVLRPLSAVGRAASTYWNGAHGGMAVSVAEGGRVLGVFDPAIPEHPSGDDAAVVGPLIAGLDLGAGDRVALGMAVVERFTGVPVTPDMLEGLDRVYVIEPVLDDPPALAEWWHSALFRADREVAAAINALPPEEQRSLAQRAAIEAVAATDLADHPVVQAAVALFEQPAARPTAEFETFVRRVKADASKTKDHEWDPVHECMVRGPKTREGWKREGAVEAVRAALHPDPLTAALDAVHKARFAFPGHQEEFIDRIRPKPRPH
jgi:hypothetical protein